MSASDLCGLPRVCVHLVLFQVSLMGDELTVEPIKAKVEGELVKRENDESILAEERDGMQKDVQYVFL